MSRFYTTIHHTSLEMPLSKVMKYNSRPASMLSPFLFTFSLLDSLPFCWSRNPWRQLRDTSQKDVSVGGSISTQKEGVPITDQSTGHRSLIALNLTYMDLFFHILNYESLYENAKDFLEKFWTKFLALECNNARWSTKQRYFVPLINTVVPTAETFIIQTVALLSKNNVPVCSYKTGTLYSI